MKEAVYYHAVCDEIFIFDGDWSYRVIGAVLLKMPLSMKDMNVLLERGRVIKLGII